MEYHLTLPIQLCRFTSDRMRSFYKITGVSKVLSGVTLDPDMQGLCSRAAAPSQRAHTACVSRLIRDG
jgi:hypothetical protein